MLYRTHNLVRTPNIRSILSRQTHRVLLRTMCAAREASTAPNYDAFFNRRSLARQPSAIRELQPFLSIPGMISLGGGMPNPTSFPFTSLEAELVDGTKITLKGSDLSETLQYSATPGLPRLVDLWTNIIEKEHTPSTAHAWGVGVTTGSQDGLAKIFDMFLDENTSLLVEAPTYSGALASLVPLGCNLVKIPTDSDGLIPEELDATLSNWDCSVDGVKPKVLYTIPTGSNPTGATLSLERRNTLLKLATKHDLLIIEDDPYYYLQFSEKRISSMFSMCSDGRVLRCDSISKLISSGLRIGFVSAPTPILHRIMLHQQSSTLHTCGVSQGLVYALLNKWGPDGFEEHVQKVTAMYAKRRDDFMASAKKHITGKAEFHAPAAGMFVWFKLLGVEDSTDIIKEKAVEKLVLMVPGKAFTPGGGPSPYVRATFSTASKEDMEEAMRRFGELLDEIKP
ncbi:hypothetical protein SARC_09449 [Sphaeroforma arctica JP610]|uniref:Aminotransferase class I/classII large domain-containing protein n=1 Tax=Sphaeroforma arctica JP610 TaxID=667725 RepID=A0A0L0FQ47_9EUKA|nr:hypothetical protein SARC_09449 [Sphaeroforma arctica JP610]KNC78098.1 hypothetical protein SARC_09449 [Sphaeroforma arctica JP610]|eukprot:XP_014152000.1 hypothetical protein SARC_09449 [Sphaeroforma arctica JP610]